ncbi:transcriptional regulator [Pontibacterium sp.]|uniref:helix-turn-helix transcriptional regulator n=1 Tax=Pontibacterium sp. TaxID=2036026 RepID=UPI003510FD15
MQVLKNAPSVGDIIHELYLKPTHLSVEGAAELCGITPEQFQRILDGSEKIGYELSFKLSQGFNTSYTFWLHLAQDHQQAQEEKQDKKLKQDDSDVSN